MKRLVLVLLTAVSAAGLQLMADDIVLVPGTITGTVTVTGVALSQVSISASAASGGGSASTNIIPNGSSSATYSLTVNVPQSSAATFSVTAWAYSDSYRDFLQLPAVQASVAAGAPGTANLGITPGFIDATINLTGAALTSVQLTASHVGNLAETTASAGTNYRFAVAPGSSVGLSGSINLLDGRSLPLAPQTVSVKAGETTSVTYNVTAPAVQNGSILGTISFPGTSSLNYAYVHMNGPSFKSQFFNAPVTNQPYQFNDVAAGNNYVPYSYVYLNNFDDYFQFPTSSFSKTGPVVVSAGQTTIVDIAAEQAFINSALTLSGAPTLMPLLNSGSTNAAGVHPSAASGGQASDLLHVATRTFDLIVSPGTWQVQGFSLSFFRPSPRHLSSSLNYFEFGTGTNVSVATGETKTRDFNVALGEVTLTLSVAGGGPFSNPQLSGLCSYTNGGLKQIYSYIVDAYSEVSNVTSSQLTIAGPTGKCTVTPSVLAGSSDPPLLPVTLDIVAGTSQVIDIGGPTLTMTSPAADQIVSSSSVTVSGRVTDDVGVAYVKVNGQEVTLSPANNPTDAKARQFSTTVNLQPGPNTITTNAGDTSSPAKTASDTRIVYYDQGGPSVAFTPADGTTTTSSSVTVTGTADDDAGVSKVTVNGSPVAFASTNNPLKPEEVSFSALVPLLEGPNPISVTVTDISTRTRTVTHTITRQTPQATALALDPGSAPFGGQVTVSAVLSTTSAPIGVLAGKTVSFTLAVAGSGVTVSASGVTDPTGTATATLPVGGLNPGTYAGALSATFAAENNYLGSTASSALTVNKLDQSISFADIQNHTLGDAPFEIAATASSNLEVNLSVVSGAASVYCSLTGNTVRLTGAGSCTVIASQPGNGIYAPADDVVRSFAIAKANATVIVSGYTGVYDGEAHGATGTATGVKGEDLASLLTLGDSFTNGPGGTATWMFAGDGNYEPQTGTAAIVISKANATVTVTGYTGVYDGDAHGATGTATGVKGEDLESLLTLGDSFTNGPGGRATWTFAGNDNYDRQTGTAAIVISKANATVTVTGYTGVYDGEAHGATGTATGVKGEKLASLLTLGDSFTNGPGGTATWTFAGDANYNAATGEVEIAIRSAPLTVTADDKAMTLGAPLPAFGAAFSGFVGDESSAVLSGLLHFTTPATSSSSVGTYAITPGGVTSGNYDITFVPGTLTISYTVCLGYDDAKVHNGGSTIPIKLQLCDAAREIRNSPSVIVHATQLVRVSNQAAGTVEDAVEANPDDNFRLTGAGYLFNLKTKGLATGTYSLFFTVTGDPSTHSVLFKIK